MKDDRQRGSMMEETPPIHPFLITVEEAARLLSLSRTMVYELINRENLPVHRFNSAVRINPTELQMWLNERKTR
ncbi:MAG: helix-turn-helix domain-containing protein [Ktedonobacteraceae bacterium]|nr:helix-turn-helix domain-containing protein [Ktedonobacteraceae bacterium]